MSENENEKIEGYRGKGIKSRVRFSFMLQCCDDKRLTASVSCYFLIENYTVLKIPSKNS